MNHRSSFPPRAPHAPRARQARTLTEKQVEALTVAMIVAPGVYARNRMFDLFSSAGAKRARTRAGLVRGIVPQLARATAVTVSSEGTDGEVSSWGSARASGHGADGRYSLETAFVLRYVILAVRLTRVVELSAAELAALRLVAERANVRALPASAADKELVARALASLMDGDVSVDVSRLAAGIAAPRGE